MNLTGTERRSRPRRRRAITSPPLLAAAVLALSLLAAACDMPGGATPTPPTSHGGPVRDHGTLLDNLRKVGLTVEPTGRVKQPFLSVEGESVKVNGQDIQSYEYAGEAAAAADAKKIAPDASVQGAHIGWVAQPQFYTSGKLIVLYVGADQTVLNALQAAMGPPFAVGTAPPQSATPNP